MPPLQKLHDAFLGKTPADKPLISASNVAPTLLPSEVSAKTLSGYDPDDGSRPGKIWWSADDDSAKKEGKPTRVYRWNEFGKEITTEFDESHFMLDGNFESNSSAGHKEFQDRIRAIHFRKEGKARADIAKLLGRSEKFVTKWWQKDEKEVPRPWGVHEYLSKEMGQKTFSAKRAGAVQEEDTATSTASWWRDVEVKRKYVQDPAVYEEILKAADWQSTVARTRDFSTGASNLKYDKEGKLRNQANQGAKYVQGLSPAFDKCLQKLFAEYGIADRTSGIGLNWYPDGGAALGSHRHDCWTALFSFGEERILTIDKTPLLCQDGDLVIFGTQRHGVPFMPEISEGRITVPIFFYPDHLQMQKQWQTLTDPEDQRASRPLIKMKQEYTLAKEGSSMMLWEDPRNYNALQQLQQLGFDEEAAQMALRMTEFDVEKAAETLLMSGAASEIDLLSNSDESTEVHVSGRWNARVRAAAVTKLGGSASCSNGYSMSSSSTDVHVAECDCGHDDAALAFKLQMEEDSCQPAHAMGATCYSNDDDMAAVLAAQLEEEELSGGQMNDELREAQFAMYNEQLTREDAEEWHGHGDLMQGGFQRAVLSLKTMDKTTCYSIGHGRLLERDFYEILSLNSIRALYDFRPSDYRGDVHSPTQCFSVRALKSTCKARGIQYKHVALGREGAYGILNHISSDEAEHVLTELVWHAKRHKTAFLGFEEDWRMDHRQVIAEALVKHGHTVKHIDNSGGTEDHKAGHQFPDFILQEEEKLRKLEKMRQAGELKRPEKSSVDRSTEAVAKRLDRPAEVVDAMDEMRHAANQKELVQVQRKLARTYRIAESKGALANKVLSNTPQWIVEEAKEQEIWIAQKKIEKAQAAKLQEGKDKDIPSQGKSESVEQESLMVECLGCSMHFPWEELTAGEGLCSTCRCSTKLSNGGEERTEELFVECSSCADLTSWQILELGDGLCPSCTRTSSAGASDNGAGTLDKDAASETLEKPAFSTSTTAMLDDGVLHSVCDDVSAQIISETPTSKSVPKAAAHESVDMCCSQEVAVESVKSTWRSRRRAAASAS